MQASHLLDRLGIAVGGAVLVALPLAAYLFIRTSF